VKSSNNLALKESTLCLELLGQGHIVCLLRKVGQEALPNLGPGVAPEFFLFPTYTALARGDVRPRWQAMADTLSGQTNIGMVRFRYYAEVRAAAQIHEPRALTALGEEIPFQPPAVMKRYETPPTGLHLLVLRVYRLEEPLLLVDRPMYDGQRNYVKLETALPLRKVTPAMGEREFESRVQVIRKALGV